MQFSLGVSYWPRRTSHWWWQMFDRGEVREDFEHIADIGFDTVRVFLRWEDFQPQPQGVGSKPLTAFEHVLDLANEKGLRVAAVLFPAGLDGSLQIPAWVNRGDALGELQRAMRDGALLVDDPQERPLVFSEQRYQRNQVRGLWDERAIVNAQQYFVREVVGNFDAHPALWAWQLGVGLEFLQRPSSADAVRKWLHSMSEAARDSANKPQVLGAGSLLGLRHAAGPRPEHYAEACDLLGVEADPPFLLSGRTNSHYAYVAFLYALSSGLAQRHGLVTSLGMPTSRTEGEWIGDSAYGKPLRVYLAHEEEQARWFDDAVQLLLRLGAQGAWLAQWGDAPRDLWGVLPFDRSMRARSAGVVRADGQEKAISNAIREFAAAKHEVQETDFFTVDAERYWYDPQAGFNEVWQQFKREFDRLD